jgi:hypothetical protein
MSEHMLGGLYLAALVAGVVIAVLKWLKSRS